LVIFVSEHKTDDDDDDEMVWIPKQASLRVDRLHSTLIIAVAEVERVLVWHYDYNL